MHPYDNFKLAGSGGVPGAGLGGLSGVGVDERYEDRGGYQYPLTEKQRAGFQEPVDDKEVRL